MAGNESLRIPPRLRGNLFTGCLKEFRRDTLGFLEKCAREYGDFVPVRVASRRGVLVSNPAAIEEILVTRHRDFRKVFTLRYNRLFLGNGLLTSEGDHWLKQRRLTQPSFHPERISYYTEIMANEAERTAAEWKPGDVRDIQQEMMQITLRTVSRCLFGSELAEAFEQIAQNMAVIQDRLKKRREAFIPLPDTLPTVGNLPLRRAIRQLDRVVYSFIDRSRSERDGDHDLVSVLSREHSNGEGMTERQLRDEVMTMFFAGHETTALALSWSWYLLALHPEVDELHQRELTRLWPPDREKPPAVSQLTWTTCIVKEALRLYPPVYAFGRDALRATTVAGHRIPAKTSLVIAPWVVHRDPRFFADPDEFLPHRWEPTRARQIPRFAYFPFSGGPRQCVGMSFAMTEAVVVLASLARHFRPQLVTSDPIELWPTFTLRAKTGIPMKILGRAPSTAGGPGSGQET